VTTAWTGALSASIQRIAAAIGPPVKTGASILSSRQVIVP
jgi:hypothetical protein